MEDKSVNIGTNIGSSIVSGQVSGNVSSEVKDSYNAYNPEQKQNLAEAAREIQELLTQLEKSYSTNTYASRMAIATETLKQIEGNPNLYKKVVSALKAGGVSAFEQLLNHPAASFVIGALSDWQSYEQQ